MKFLPVYLIARCIGLYIIVVGKLLALTNPGKMLFSFFSDDRTSRELQIAGE